MMISGLAFGFMCILKETYAPALLKKESPSFVGKSKTTNDIGLVTMIIRFTFLPF